MHDTACNTYKTKLQVYRWKEQEMQAQLTTFNLEYTPQGQPTKRFQSQQLQHSYGHKILKKIFLRVGNISSSIEQLNKSSRNRINSLLTSCFTINQDIAHIKLPTNETAGHILEINTLKLNYTWQKKSSVHQPANTLSVSREHMCAHPCNGWDPPHRKQFHPPLLHQHSG